MKIGHPKRKLVFQPSIFRGYFSFREGSHWLSEIISVPGGGRKLQIESLGIHITPGCLHIRYFCNQTCQETFARSSLVTTYPAEPIQQCQSRTYPAVPLFLKQKGTILYFFRRLQHRLRTSPCCKTLVDLFSHRLFRASHVKWKSRTIGTGHTAAI